MSDSTAVTHELRDYPIGRSWGTYDSAIPASIAGLTLNVPSAVLADADEATRAATRYDATTSIRLGLACALEAIASSAIEGIHADGVEVFTALAGAKAGENARLIASNAAAIRAALTGADAVAVHEALLGATRPEWTGRFRKEVAWVGGFSPLSAQFVPPHPDHVAAAMTDLTGFTDRADLPTLVQAAIAHAQFETIHPFPDGNGRTGRALIHRALTDAGVTRTSLVPVSVAIRHHTGDYIDALTSFRRGQPEPIVSYFADITLNGVARMAALDHRLGELREEWRERLTGIRRDAVAHRVAELLLEHPVVTTKLILNELDVTRTAAITAVSVLTACGVIEQLNGHTRNRSWGSTELLDELDSFERKRRP